MLQVSSIQLRDDLLSMLVSGHETTGSVLTWTTYLLSKVLHTVPFILMSVPFILMICVSLFLLFTIVDSILLEDWLDVESRSNSSASNDKEDSGFIYLNHYIEIHLSLLVTLHIGFFLMV